MMMKKAKKPATASPEEAPVRPAKRPSKDSFYTEEELAQPVEPQECVSQFKEHCASLRKLAAEIYEAKLTKKKTCDLTDFMTPLTRMKELNRIAQFRLKTFREMTQERKVQIDQHHLKLQNLMYEVIHLEKEISKCLEFRSKHDDIPLISVEEFYASAPSEITRPDLTMNDEHQQTLARLTWELEQRKELAKQLKTADESIDTVRKEIQSKKDFLTGLLPQLREITETTKPLQEYMNIPFNKEIEQNALAVLLPSALYTLFTEVKAYSVARDPAVSLTVEGDAEEARSVRPLLLEARFSSSRLTDAAGSSIDGVSAAAAADSEDDGDSSGEAEAVIGGGSGGGGGGAGGGNGSDRAADKRSGTPISRKEKTRHRRRGSKSQRTVEEEALNALLRLHPLSVVVSVSMKGGAVLCLQFHYAMTLKVVTVKTQLNLPPRFEDEAGIGADLLSPNLLLAHLYPNDSGCASGLHVLRHELQKAKVADLTAFASRLGIPYAWVQRLAGLDLLPTAASETAGPSGLDLSAIPSPDLEVAFDHSVECFERIKRRVAARLALIRELGAIERNEWRLTDSQQKLVPLRLSCRLRAWRKITFEDFQELPQSQKFIREGLAQAHDFFFAGAIEREAPPRSRASVHCIVPADYAADTPIALLSLPNPAGGNPAELHSGNSLQIQELETTVNCHLSEFALGREWTPGNGLIACQLQRLLSCFDVLIEAGVRAEAGGQADRRAVKSMRMLRPAKYPSRRMPYKYSEAFDTFVQR